jgi:hypothetical protein
VAVQNDDDDGQPWHNRTPALVGASLAALVVVGILIVAATAVARQFGEPEQAPIDFVEPTYSATTSQSGTATTTQTITSTSPPETTDINASSTSSSSSSSTTSSSSESSTEQTTARTEDTETEDRPTRTTRQRPRTNVTRTFNPFG